MGVLTASWASGKDFAKKMVPKRMPKCSQEAPKRPTWANMGAKLAPRWRYVGQFGAQDGHHGGIWGAILAHSTDLERHFTGIWKMQKTSENLMFFKVFGGWEGRAGRYLDTILGYVGASWL